ncbi:sensor histidine kinase [Glaciihabitans arcticus]|uniref:sensor histidine kinase n=1 Tax=Glaciihabitans arcticus TaxID=2668039 RepID=UPI0013867FF1|nr:histidine kinase [Glaciihabitans arcticus]
MPSLKAARSSIVIGWLMVAGVAIAIAALAVGATLSTTLYGVPIAISFLLAALHASSIPLAIPRPLLAGVISAASVLLFAVVQSGSDAAPWPWAVVTLVTHSVTLVLVGLQARRWIAVASWATASLATIAVALVLPRYVDAPAINIIIAASISGVAVAGGIVWREWREIRAQLIRARSESSEEHEFRVIAEEKTRIARELHDIVAHSMSIINVQASTAVFRHQGVPEPVAREFGEIAEAARGAIAELRGVLGVLREDGSPLALAPQPGLEEIPALVEAASRSGVTIALEGDDSRELPPVGEPAALAAFRVVQEAISNAIRHAPDAAIRVRVSHDPTAMTVEVVNDASEHGIRPVGSGHGITGMRERVAAVSGDIRTGATEAGGFSVVARIPRREAGA